MAHVAAAPPAPVAAGGAAAGRPAYRSWQPVVPRHALARAQLGIAVATAAFACFALTFAPANFPNLPAHCVMTAADAVDLRYRAAVLLLYAMAQAGAAAAALVVVPPSRIGCFLAFVANLLGMTITNVHLFRVVVRLLFATGALCSGGMVDLIFAAIFAAIFLCAVHILCLISQEPQDH